MPNHVRNMLTFNGDPERIREMLTQIQDDEEGFGSIDFNKLIPMPQELGIESGSRTNEGLKFYNDFLEIYTLGQNPKEMDLLHIPEEREEAFLKRRTDIDRQTWDLGKQAFQNRLRFGAATWYAWCTNNWGTKWNAYDVFYNDGTLGFDTAWSAPHPVIEKLAEMFPDVQITHEWADEDIGCNCGRREYADGELVEEFFPLDGRDAYEFAAGVWDEELLDWGLVLNSDETDYISVSEQSFDGINICGQIGLFAAKPLPAHDLPLGMSQYYLEWAEDGNKFGGLTMQQPDNSAGCVITASPINLGTDGRLTFTDENRPAFTNQSMTFEDVINQDANEDEALGGMQL